MTVMGAEPASIMLEGANVVALDKQGAIMRTAQLGYTKGKPWIEELLGGVIEGGTKSSQQHSRERGGRGRQDGWELVAVQVILVEFYPIEASACKVGQRGARHGGHLPMATDRRWLWRQVQMRDAHKAG